MEDGQNQRSARRSAQNAKWCVQDAKRCEKETVGRDNDVPENDRRKRLRIAKLGEQVRDDASDDESSREGTRTLTSVTGPGITRHGFHKRQRGLRNVTGQAEGDQNSYQFSANLRRKRQDPARQHWFDDLMVLPGRHL